MPVHVGQINSDVIHLGNDAPTADQHVEPPRRRWVFDNAARSSRARDSRLQAVDRDD